MSRHSVVALLLVALGLVAGCGVQSPEGQVGDSETSISFVEGEPAVWVLDSDASLDESTVEFTALVSRLSCNGGVTGFVFGPDVDITDSQVVVTFLVDPVSEEGDCSRNDQVRYRIQLDEPLGSRDLVDGGCIDGDEALTIAWCADEGTRWAASDG